MPNYVNFCIENFKRINPTFKINFVHRTSSQLEDIFFNKHIINDIDKILYNLIFDIINNNRYIELIKLQK
jgi:hypothetical protein